METLLDRSRLDNYISNLNDETLNGDFDVIFRDAPLPKDSFCGIGPLRGRFLHKWVKLYHLYETIKMEILGLPTKNRSFLFSV